MISPSIFLCVEIPQGTLLVGLASRLIKPFHLINRHFAVMIFQEFSHLVESTRNRENIQIEIISFDLFLSFIFTERCCTAGASSFKTPDTAMTRSAEWHAWPSISPQQRVVGKA